MDITIRCAAEGCAWERRRFRRVGEVRTFFGDCGCPIRPERVELIPAAPLELGPRTVTRKGASGTPPAGGPRTVAIGRYRDAEWFASGGGAIGRGPTEELAIKVWRADLARAQREADARTLEQVAAYQRRRELERAGNGESGSQNKGGE